MAKQKAEVDVVTAPSWEDFAKSLMPGVKVKGTRVPVPTADGGYVVGKITYELPSAGFNLEEILRGLARLDADDVRLSVKVRGIGSTSKNPTSGEELVLLYWPDSQAAIEIIERRDTLEAERERRKAERDAKRKDDVNGAGQPNGTQPSASPAQTANGDSKAPVEVPLPILERGKQPVKNK